MGTKELELVGTLTQTLEKKFEEGVEALKDIPVTEEKFGVTLNNTMSALQLSDKFKDMFRQLYQAETQIAEQETNEEGSAD
jgi:hypothetical protein